MASTSAVLGVPHDGRCRRRIEGFIEEKEPERYASTQDKMCRFDAGEGRRTKRRVVEVKDTDQSKSVPVSNNQAMEEFPPAVATILVTSTGML